MTSIRSIRSTLSIRALILAAAIFAASLAPAAATAVASLDDAGSAVAGIFTIDDGERDPGYS